MTVTTVADRRPYSLILLGGGGRSRDRTGLSIPIPCQQGKIQGNLRKQAGMHRRYGVISSINGAISMENPCATKKGIL
jgi:hypothetical protein